MKKVFLAIAVASVFTACNSSETTATDAPKVDSPKVEAPKMDTPAVAAPKMDTAAKKK